MPVALWAITYVPCWNTSATKTDIVEIREDGQYILNSITGQFHKTNLPFTAGKQTGYTWEEA